MSQLSDELAKIKIPQQKKKGPVWAGPEKDGITFSLLSKFLCCRERFRCLVVEGLKPKEEFFAPLEFGNMWHICEEAHAAKLPYDVKLLEYCKFLCGKNEKYRLQQPEIERWYHTAKLMFPIYVDYWKKNPDVVNRTPLMQEQVFDVPYRLPSGRIVRLRGKWDSIDLVKDASAFSGIYIQENKTKSEIDEEGIRRQLTYDLQTMMYTIALQQEMDARNWAFGGKERLIRGVRYNVVKRPRQYQGKKESPDQFYERLEGIVKDAPNEFFARWKVEINSRDIEAFKTKTFDPILESLCNWWHYITNQPMTGKDHDYLLYGRHWVHPFGIYNSLLEGGGTHLDNYMMTGDDRGLSRTDNLYPELT